MGIYTATIDFDFVTEGIFYDLSHIFSYLFYVFMT